MSLIAALAQMLNSGGHTSIGGALGKAGNIAGNFLSGNPGYMDSAMNESDLQSKQIANQNAPLMNALQQQLLQSKLAGSNIANQYMPQTIQSKNALQNAQAGMIGAKLKDPYYGHFLPGPAGVEQGLQIIKDKYGENSQEYNRALNQITANTDWKSQLAKTVPLRAASSMGKQQIERENVSQGNTPIGNTYQQQIGNMGGNQMGQTMQPQQQQPNALQRAMMQSMQPQQQGQMQQQQGQPQLSTGSPQLSADNFQQMQQPQQIKTDAGDYYASPAYANNPNLRQYDMEANKKAVDTATWQQFNAAREIESYARSPEVRSSLEQYAKYAGVWGRGARYLDNLKSNQPEEYQKAMEAKRITIQNLTNLQRRMEKLGVQNQTRQDVSGMFDGAVELLTTSPKTALSLINAGLKHLSLYSNTLYNVAQPIRKVYQPEEFTPIGGQQAQTQTQQQVVAQKGAGSPDVQAALAELKKRGRI